MVNDSIKVIKGRDKIILSAPHSVLHMREKSIRTRETKTGVIVKTLANRCNVYGIYKTKNEYNDANWDKKCEYKNSLKNIINQEKIKAIIDIHGMAAHRKQDICIGVNEGKNIYGYNSILNNMIKIFNNYGFKNVTIDEPFGAKYEYCVSSYISRNCRIPAFQIEINAKYRIKKYKEYNNYNKLLYALKEIIELMDKEI